MRLRPILFTCLALFLVTACGATPPATPLPTPYFLVTAPFDATPTATPFQPEGFMVDTPAAPVVTLPPVATEPPTPTVPAPAASRSYPTLQTDPVTTLTPEPAPLISKPAGQVSILLLGSDKRPDSPLFRTDVMILMTVKADGSISLVSFPRDLFVYIPGFKMARINGAFLYGGYETLAQTLEYNFGVRPDYYIMTNFNGFMTMVDSLGGVDVNVQIALYDQRTGYADGFTVNPGQVHMDGETALWYVRSRKSSSDFDRLRRAQEVIVAMGQKLLTLGALDRIPEFYQAFQGSVSTDLSLDDLLRFLPLIQQVDLGRVSHYVVTMDYTTEWIEPGSGAYLLLPHTGEIQQLLQQAMGTP